MSRMDYSIKHVALIMDGNRRWAEEKGIPQLEGHRNGYNRIEGIVDRGIELGISHLTFWAFSTENWKREKEEVDYLLNLFRELFSKQVDKFHRKNVRVNVLGNLDMFPQDIQEMTRKWIEKTKDNKKITVNMALSYGGRDEIIRAVNKVLKSHITHHTSRITEDEFARHLDTAGQPDPDLLIRTGRQRRLSGFLPWQTTYTELYFTDVLWPDFTPSEFDRAIEWYKEQKRNFGT